MIEVKNSGKEPVEQTILDCGPEMRKESALYPEHCMYNFKILNACYLCNPNSSGDF